MAPVRTETEEGARRERAGVNCIAHRGFAGTFPENTLLAVRRALAEGADGIEVDVRRCGSGEPVVIHDATVDRVTDRSGAVSALSRSALTDCSVLNTGEGVPTLEAVCECLPADVRLHVELKEPGVAADAVSVADSYPFDLQVSSFEPEALQAVTAVSDAPLAYLFGTDSSIPSSRAFGRGPTARCRLPGTSAAMPSTPTGSTAARRSSNAPTRRGSRSTPGRCSQARPPKRWPRPASTASSPTRRRTASRASESHNSWPSPVRQAASWHSSAALPRNSAYSRVASSHRSLLPHRQPRTPQLCALRGAGRGASSASG